MRKYEFRNKVMDMNFQTDVFFHLMKKSKDNTKF